MKTDPGQMKFNLHEQDPSLTQVSVSRSVLALGSDWAVIVGAAALAQWSPGVFTLVLAQLLIASRQHGLFMMMHEGAHGFLCRNRKWNDRAANWFAAWPTFISMERFRARHWDHHKYTNTEQDPDWGRKQGDPQWTFPKTKFQFWRDLLPYAWGRGIVEMTYAQMVIGLDRKQLLRAAPYYALAATLFTLTGTWKLFLVYWMLPYGVILPALHRGRIITEHFALPNENPLTRTRNILHSPVEAYFFGPHGNSIHLVHHLCPYIPWHKMPAARQLLLQNETYRAHARENDTYFLPWGASAYGDLLGENPQLKEKAGRNLAA